MVILIQSYLGFPDKSILNKSKLKKNYFNEKNIFYKGFSNKGKMHIPNTKSFDKFLHKENKELVEIIKVS